MESSDVAADIVTTMIRVTAFRTERIKIIENNIKYD